MRFAVNCDDACFPVAKNLEAWRLRQIFDAMIGTVMFFSRLLREVRHRDVVTGMSSALHG
jgi:hypothetical protein